MSLMPQSLTVIPTRTGKTLHVHGQAKPMFGGAMADVDLKLTNDQVAELVEGLTNGGVVEIRDCY